LVDVSQKFNPKILETLQGLGYSNVEIKNERVYARRGRDHIIIRLSKRGNPDFRIKAHQDFPTKSLPSHHYAEFAEERRLIKEFRRAFREELKSEQ
jgi:hypothetical protein